MEKSALHVNVLPLPLLEEWSMMFHWVEAAGPFVQRLLGILCATENQGRH